MLCVAVQTRGHAATVPINLLQHHAVTCQNLFLHSDARKAPRTCASSSPAPSAVPICLISPSKRLNPSCTSRVSMSTWLPDVLSLSNVTSSAFEWYLEGTVQVQHSTT